MTIDVITLEDALGKIESAANLMRGLGLDPSIHSEAKRVLAIAVASLDEFSERLAEQIYREDD